MSEPDRDVLTRECNLLISYGGFRTDFVGAYTKNGIQTVESIILYYQGVGWSVGGHWETELRQASTIGALLRLRRAKEREKAGIAPNAVSQAKESLLNAGINPRSLSRASSEDYSRAAELVSWAQQAMDFVQQLLAEDIDQGSQRVKVERAERILQAIEKGLLIEKMCITPETDALFAIMSFEHWAKALRQEYDEKTAPSRGS